MIQTMQYFPAEELIAELLRRVGEDPTREGLLDTPSRVVRAWQEMTAGYRTNPAEILGTTFSSDNDQMVICKDIEFYSTCEHHLLPFHGRAHIGYLPGKAGRVFGLSKLARLVECYARRLQIQEQMTEQIAKALVEHGQPLGVAVVIEAQHLCMKSRGVRNHSSVMVTSSMQGVFRDEHASRTEFLRLIGR